MTVGSVGRERAGANMARCWPRAGATPVLTTVPYRRFTSRDEETDGGKVISAMRMGLGAHMEPRKDES